MNFGTDNRLPRYTQWLNYSIALASLLVVVLGSLYNSEGLKHSIAKVPAQYSSSIYHTLPHCSKRVLVLNLHDSILCCDEGNRDHDWLCYASFDRLSRLLSHSTWAWLLPLLPLALSYLADCAHLVLFDKSLAHFMSVTRSAARRMLFYFSLVLFRSVRYFSFSL